MESHAVNCLTGVYSEAAGNLSHALPEHAIFTRGNGYLFRAGKDERGYPEFTFPVEQTGADGVTRSGFTVHHSQIRTESLYDDLDRLLRRYGTVVVWVNTAHLGYAGVYLDNPPYLHAILIDGVARDRSGVFLLDTLIVGNTPYSAKAFLSTADLLLAISDDVRTESHGGMGIFYTISSSSRAAVPEREALNDQAMNFITIPEFKNGIEQYKKLCFAAFRDEPRRATAARRLFHHSSVLYLTPSLSLLGRALSDAGMPGSLQAQNVAIIQHWQAMGVLALRYQATESSRVLDRIEARFDLIGLATEQFWSELSES